MEQKVPGGFGPAPRPVSHHLRKAKPAERQSCQCEQQRRSAKRPQRITHNCARRGAILYAGWETKQYTFAPVAERIRSSVSNALVYGVPWPHLITVDPQAEIGLIRVRAIVAPLIEAAPEKVFASDWYHVGKSCRPGLFGKWTLRD